MEFTGCISSLWRDQHGAVAIEAAFVLPILLLAGFGAMDASYLLLQNHKMETGLSNAANYLAFAPNPSSVEAQAKNIATRGTITATGDAVLRGWTASDITIGYKTISNSTDNDNQSLYRGGAAIKVVQLSSQKTYSGFGVLKSVMGSDLVITAKHEQRLVAIQSGA